MKDIEIEIQVRISNPAKLRDFLAKKAKPAGSTHHKDEYYTPSHRDFVGVRPAVEWLRLRESDHNSITYKHWYYNTSDKSEYCDEYETQVDDLEPLRKTFAALDFKLLITVDKKRETWAYKDYEIALDHVTGLGDFVEVEYKAHDSQANPKKITDDMTALLKQAGSGKIERNYRGYPFMLLYPEEVTFEEV